MSAADVSHNFFAGAFDAIVQFWKRERYLNLWRGAGLHLARAAARIPSKFISKISKLLVDRFLPFETPSMLPSSLPH
jgi:hypothetical protein